MLRTRARGGVLSHPADHVSMWWEPRQHHARFGDECVAPSLTLDVRRTVEPSLLLGDEAVGSGSLDHPQWIRPIVDDVMVWSLVADYRPCILNDCSTSASLLVHRRWRREGRRDHTGLRWRRSGVLIGEAYQRSPRQAAIGRSAVASSALCAERDGRRGSVPALPRLSSGRRRRPR